MFRNRFGRPVYGGLVAIATGVALAGCGGGDSGGGANASSAGTLPAEVPVTYISEQTGPVAYVGKRVLAGMELALDEINASKMLGETKIKLSVKDTASQQATATTQMAQAVKSDAVAIFGPHLAGSVLAAGPIAQRAGVPLIEVSANDDEILTIGDHLYRLSAAQNRYNNLTADQVAKKGAKSVTMIYNNDNATLVDLAQKKFPEKFGKLGVKVNDSVATPIAATDFAALASKAMRGNPDAIGILVIGVQNGGIAKALRQAGYKGTLFGQYAASAGALESAGEAAEGFIYSLDFTEDMKWDSSKKFVEAFKQKFPNETPYGFDSHGYDAMMVFAQALLENKDASREGVLKGLQAISKKGFEGASGPMRFIDPEGRDVSAPGVTVEWRDGAEQVLDYGNPEEDTQP